jgi:putative FmdB family regulatory protein
MPIYEYLCADCGKRSEVFRRSMSAAETTVACAHCGGARTSRAISQFAFAKSGDVYGSSAEESYLDSLGEMGGMGGMPGMGGMGGFGGDDDFGGLDDDF